MSSDPLQHLEDLVAPLLKSISASEQRKLATTIARDLIRSQRRRIGSQRNPDGSPFEPRKQQGDASKPNRPKRFLYDGPYSSRGERVAEVKSYRDEGDRLVGYDIEARGVRTFIKGNMLRHLAPTSTSGDRIRDRRGQIRKMFERMQGKLKTMNDANGVAVGFVGRTARIAEIHQYGLRDQVSPGKSASYAARQLLGFTGEDIEHIRDLVLEHIEKNSA